MVVAEACGWMERRKGKERGRSVLCWHGWCVCVRVEEKRREGGEEGEGGEEATDSIEHQNAHKQFFWLGSSLSQN